MRIEALIINQHTNWEIFKSECQNWSIFSLRNTIRISHKDGKSVPKDINIIFKIISCTAQQIARASEGGQENS